MAQNMAWCMCIIFVARRTIPHVVSYGECFLQGSDLVLGGYDVTSSSECCLKCSELKQCSYWTYATKGDKQGKCWVKSDSKSYDAEHTKLGRSSGDRESGYYDPCEDKANRRDNHDYAGSDLVKGGFSNTTPDTCCAHCIATKGCKYWVFGKDNNKCWVKADIASSEEKWNRMSGWFVESPTPTLPPTLPPSLQPTLLPTLQPTLQPSLQPSLQPLGAASNIVTDSPNLPPPSHNHHSHNPRSHKHHTHNPQSPLSQPTQRQPPQPQPAQPSGPSTCCLACSGNKQCKGWTFCKTGNSPGKCLVDGEKCEGESVSGLYDPCQDKTNYEDNRDYFGSDLVKGGFSNMTPAKCCAKCIATKGCKYWTFGKDDNKCWVKANPTGNKRQGNRLSGTFVVGPGGTLATSATASTGPAKPTMDCNKPETFFRGSTNNIPRSHVMPQQSRPARQASAVTSHGKSIAGHGESGPSHGASGTSRHQSQPKVSQVRAMVDQTQAMVSQVRTMVNKTRAVSPPVWAGGAVLNSDGNMVLQPGQASKTAAGAAAATTPASGSTSATMAAPAAGAGGTASAVAAAAAGAAAGVAAAAEAGAGALTSPKTAALSPGAGSWASATTAAANMGAGYSTSAVAAATAAGASGSTSETPADAFTDAGGVTSAGTTRATSFASPTTFEPGGSNISGLGLFALCFLATMMFFLYLSTKRSLS